MQETGTHEKSHDGSHIDGKEAVTEQGEALKEGDTAAKQDDICRQKLRPNDDYDEHHAERHLLVAGSKREQACQQKREHLHSLTCAAIEPYELNCQT